MCRLGYRDSAFQTASYIPLRTSIGPAESLRTGRKALITTYPGAHYAAVWGTSFSSALVAGGADLLLAAAKSNSSSKIQPGDIKRALG